MTRQKISISPARDVDALNKQLNNFAIDVQDKHSGEIKKIAVLTMSGCAARFAHIEVREDDDLILEEDFAVVASKHSLMRAQQRMGNEAAYIIEADILFDLMALLRRNRVFETLFYEVRCDHEAVLIDAKRNVAYILRVSNGSAFYVRTVLSIGKAINEHGCLAVNSEDTIIVTGEKGFFSTEIPPYVKVKP